MKKVKISMIINIIIFILVVFSVIVMMTGFEFTGKNVLLTDTHVNNFKFFTVDSNIFVGISSLLLFIGEYLYLKNKKSINKILSILKYISTVSVLITMLVTIFFLVPFANARVIDFYQNSNLFFHLLIPIISFISVVFFDPIDIKFKDTFLGVIPLLVYAVYYLTSVYTHLDHGKVLWKYDFYGFLKWGPSSIIYVAPIAIIFTYLISIGLWFSYKKLNN